ncbi:RNF170 [Lepeophtheirus salmonis]|uniref:RNF170 n=1 Tax=Lepeophtheirus salmonis TaxID=72036 RepID=A0A7R8CKS9_LEPSM|nr:RNF170 [Lepeophtheirus salmonis]CAF2849030.1 RNF170 [Lepeophtheirus salmonis]
MLLLYIHKLGASSYAKIPRLSVFERRSSFLFYQFKGIRFLFEIFECMEWVTNASCFLMLSDSFLYSSPTSSPSSLMSNLNNRVRSESPECSICLESVRFAVETNCGHVFCGACLVEYVDRLATLSTPTCPYCRQRITMILLYFTPEESQDSLQDADRKLRNFLIEKIKSYNRSYSDEPRSILEQIRDFPILARRLWNMFWDYPDRTTLFFRIRVLIPNKPGGSTWLKFCLECGIDLHVMIEKGDRRSGRGDGGGSGKPLRRAPPERRVFHIQLPV